MEMIIGGKKVWSRNGKTIEVHNPATHELIDSVPSAAVEDLKEMMQYALKGKVLWKNTPLYERTKALKAFVDKVAENLDELSRLYCRENGKNISMCYGEFGRLLDCFNGYIEKANHFYGINMPMDYDPQYEKDIVYTVREPLGIFACIVPFNSPVILLAHKIAPALVTGNAVIIKPASDCPLTVVKLVEMLIDAGVPGSVAQAVTGSGAVIGSWLSSCPHIDAISLTGSTEVGIEIAENSAKHMRRLFFELGGNDPLIVFEDGDMKLAVDEAVKSRTKHAGQVCCASKRFIIHNDIKAKFTDALIEALSALKTGDPIDPSVDVGPLINKRAALIVKEQVDLTIRQGARCVYGGIIFNETFFEPTVLTDVTPDMDIACDLEVFGPIFPILGFETEEEAIRIANNTKYGLMGGVISADIKKALKTAYKLECGGVVINGNGWYRPVEIAFGGYKMSGIGREGISYTLEEVTQIKTIILRKILE